MWDVSSGKEVGALKGHESATLRVVGSRRASFLASNSVDNTVRLWELRGKAGELVQTLPFNRLPIGLAVGPRGRSLAACTASRVFVYPLRFGLWKKPPKELLQSAEARGNLALKGFKLEAR